MSTADIFFTFMLSQNIISSNICVVQEL